MKLNHSELQLETLAARLLKKEIDLQPDFQRNEVWSYSKKQKLIDSIIRDWAIPPVFLISRNNGDCEEVLDGQQRLTAIRDFFDNKIKIDGGIKPVDDEIKVLDNIYYDNLPLIVKKRINRFVVKVYTVDDYEPDEASELFYRLNQPTSLTAGEQRNALYGVRRNQMKKVVDYMVDKNIGVSVLGFSNSRLAYDDVIARALVIFNIRTLRVKISEKLITDEFREKKPFEQEMVDKLIDSLNLISGVINEYKVKFNKASYLSFLVSVYYGCDPVRILHFLSKDWDFFPKINSDALNGLHYIFTDRSSSRVTDISSVVIRDFCLHCISQNKFFHESIDPCSDLYDVFDSVLLNLDVRMDFDKENVVKEVEKEIMDCGWGRYFL